MPKTFRSKSSDHVPVVPTMVSNPIGVKKINVYRNADAYFHGMQVVVNTHRVPNIDVVLDIISEKIGLINGAKKLYTTNGIQIKDINKLRDNESYVASSSHFTPMAYGGIENKKKEEKKKKRRSKSQKPKKKNTLGEIIHEIKDNIINPKNEEEIGKIPEKPKKKKSIKKRENKNADNEQPRFVDIPRRNSEKSIESGTAEIELPSEIEESDSEKEKHIKSRESTSDHRPPTRRSTRKTSIKPNEQNTTNKKESEKEIRRKSVARRKSQPNWGDLSSFTKNIESLLRH